MSFCVHALLYVCVYEVLSFASRPCVSAYSHACVCVCVCVCVQGLTGLASSDSMLLNIMTLPKGRSMLSRALRVLLGRPQQPVSASSPAAAAVASVSPEQLLWALMRNAWTVYGSSVSDMNLRGQQLMSMVEATHK